MENMSTRRKQAELVTGGKVDTVHLDVGLMLERGMLVTMHVYGTNIFDRTLNLAELGIDDSSDEVKGRIRAGKSSMFPEMSKRVGSWSTQCRNAYRRHCISLPVIDSLTASKSWRLLLYSGYDDFAAQMEKLDAVVAKIKTDAIARRDEMIEDNRTFWKGLARENWLALQARYEGGVALSVPGHTFGPYDRVAYEEWVVNKALAALPTDEQIMSSLYSSWSTSILFSDADVAEQEARIMRAAADEAEARMIIHEERRADLEIRELTMAQRERAAAIKAAELEKAREEIGHGVSVFSEIVKGLYAELKKATADMLGKYHRNHSFRGRSLERVAALQDVYRIMGGEFVTDKELTVLVERLAKAAAQSKDDVKPEDIAADLEAIQAIVSVEKTTQKRITRRIPRRIEAD